MQIGCPIGIDLSILREYIVARISPPSRQHLQVAAQLSSQRRRGVIVESACQRQIVVGIEKMQLLHECKVKKKRVERQTSRPTLMNPSEEGSIDGIMKTIIS